MPNIIPTAHLPCLLFAALLLYVLTINLYIMWPTGWGPMQDNARKVKLVWWETIQTSITLPTTGAEAAENPKCGYEVDLCARTCAFVCLYMCMLSIKLVCYWQH